jgi:hypothetical protein
MTNDLQESQSLHSKIYTIREMKVMLDRDLAELYRTPTKRLNEQVKRNALRFPPDFMFQLTTLEVDYLRSHFATANISLKSRKPPFAFTQEGIAMLSSVLNSDIAIRINIRIMRVFIEIRSTVSNHPQNVILAEKIRRIEQELQTANMTQLIENHLHSDKLTHLSRHVHTLSQKVDQFSEILAQFQNTHVIVKRPDEGFAAG